ncbi:MAG: hypothetical protein U0903_09800 [Planctomycetales bacterium]
MARKTPNRLELRKQAEAAEAAEDELELELDADDADDSDDDSDDESPKKKKKPVKKKPATRVKRTKTKAVTRKKMIWVVYSSSMKEEATFPYAEKEEAEQKAEALRQKNKREYFVQPRKEPIAEPPAAAKAAKEKKEKDA